MAPLKKLFVIGIFISILSIFAMSHNANAIDTVIDLSNYDLAYYNRAPIYICNYSDNTTSTGYSCKINSSKDLISASSNNLYNLKVGDIVETYAMAYSGNSFTTGQNASGTLSGLLYPSNFVGSGKADVISFEPVILHSDSEILNYYNYWNIRNAGTGQYVEGYPEITQGFQHYSIYKIFVRVRENFSSNGERFIIYGSSAQPLFTMLPSYNSADIDIYFPYFKVWRSTESKENKEVEEKTQEAVDESQSAGSSSSSSASQGGANLLSAISGFFGVISSARPTNCVFNAPLNTYFGNQRLNVDLCSLDLPSGIGALTSIIAIGILIPFAIHMFNKFISLFRSFQN